jgi:hypothetical protein
MLEKRLGRKMGQIYGKGQRIVALLFSSSLLLLL